MSREEEEGKECVRKWRCRHSDGKLFKCRFRSFSSCGRYADSCQNKLVENQEPDELTRVYYNQRRKVCSSSKKHQHQCHKHHYNHSDHFHGNHESPTMMNYRSDHYREGSQQILSMNAGIEEDLVPMVGGHGLVKGIFKNEGFITTKDKVLGTELRNKYLHLGGQEKDWLTLNLSKPPKPRVENFKLDDIKLGLPGNSLSGVSKVTQEIDLNVVAAYVDEGLKEISVPSTPLSCNFGSPALHQSSGPSQDLLHHKVTVPTPQQAWKEGLHGAGSCLKESHIVILDDSEDEYMKNDDQNIDASLSNREVEWTEEGENLNAIKKVLKAESIDDCAALGRDDEERVALKDNSTAIPCIQRDKDKALAINESFNVVENGWCESKKGAQSLTQNSSTLGDDVTSVKERPAAAAGVQCGIQDKAFGGFKPRKKRMIDKDSLPFLDPVENDNEDDASVATLGGTLIVQKAFLSKMVVPKPRMWESDTLCDLCHKGPLLSMGEWYAWCCGLRLHSCGCSPGLKAKLKSGMSTKKSSKARKNDDISWSGMVHKMCALWSCEVYEEGEGLQGLWDAVKRGKSLTCTACREYGATLGCRVKTCRRSFHYPCADELASQLRCRMWDGVQFPIACRGHRHVLESRPNAKDKAPDLKKWRFRGFVQRRKPDLASGTRLLADQSPVVTSSSFKVREYEANEGSSYYSQPGRRDFLDKKENTKNLDMVIEISSGSEDINKRKGLNSCVKHNVNGSSNCTNVLPRDHIETSFKKLPLNQQEIGQPRHGDLSCALYHMGSNVLCEDISWGREAVLIPCTNDVDSDPAPAIKYITESRYLERAKHILKCLLLDGRSAARTCGGCDINTIDNPHKEASVHAALKDCRRESDTRFDWQGQPMFGRLPYDQFGRLQLGPETKDIIECNSRCPCGLDCLNRELQKGIRTPLEVFKTLDRGWGVRTMEQIARGKFVVEYVGEVLTHGEAYERGLKYDSSNFSCLFSVDHPDVPVEHLLVIDGFHMSNVSRFINHSCDGNLSVYRVYTDTTDLRFCRVGLYALRDIEIGEELSYDYNYSVCKDTKMKDFSTDPTSIKCLCGARNCRQWLWTGTL